MKPFASARSKRRWLLRAANGAALRLGRRLRPARAPGLPRLLMIEPTNLCNLHCPLCPTGAGTLKRPAGRMLFELYRPVWSCTAPTCRIRQECRRLKEIRCQQVSLRLGSARRRRAQRRFSRLWTEEPLDPLEIVFTNRSSTD